jgi:hypothetical protein
MHYYDLAGDESGLRAVLEGARTSTQRRVWMRFGADLRSVLSSRRSGRSSVREWVRPFGRPVSFAVFRWSDPLPFALLVLQRTRDGLIWAAKSLGVLDPARRAYRRWRRGSEGVTIPGDEKQSQTRAD